MQPAYAIPPLTEEGVKKLIGLWAGFPVLNKRSTTRGSYWWGNITHVRFVNEQEAMVWIITSHKRSGNSRWTRLSEVKFSGHIYEPLKISIHRAQLAAKELGIK